MSHYEVHTMFVTLIPYLAEKTETWFSNGKNSIRIRLYNKEEYVFTYNGATNWKLETKNSFIDSMKGIKR